MARMTRFEKGFAMFKKLLSHFILFGLVSISSAQDKISLRVANWGTAEEVKLEEEIAAEFMRLHPDIEVLIESIPTNYKEKILTYIAAGEPPDVFLLDSVIIPALLNKGILLDLQPFLASLNVNLGDYFPNVLDIFSKGESLYALPKDFTPLVMYYNKTLFEAARLSYPANDWTWDDYLRLAQQLTKDEDGDGRPDQFGTVFSNYFYLWQPWVWMAAGDIFDSTGVSAAGYFDAPATERALQFLIDLRTRHRVAPDDVALKTGAGATGMFLSGKIAMISSGHWSLPAFKKYIARGDLKIGTVPLPRPAGGSLVTPIYAAGWCVPKSTPQREWALRLAAFFSNTNAARIRSRSGIGVPAVKTIAQWQHESDPYQLEQAFIESIPYGRQPWGTKIDEFSRVETMTQNAVEEVMIGGKNIHEVFSATARALDQELKNLARLSNQSVALKGNPEALRFLWIVVAVSLIVAGSGILIAKPAERKALMKAYGFLAPSFFLLLIFVFAPLLFSLYLSFHQWNVVSAAKPFVGWENFQTLFTDRAFWNALKNTAIYSLYVPAGMAVSLAVALMMNQKIRGVNFLRTLFFLPSVSSFVAIALVWQWMYHPQFGLANYLLSWLGLPPLNWLRDPSTALFAIMLMSIWVGIGYQMVIFLAGLQNIPPEFYEAALTDGANAWQRFWKITLPLLMPTTFFILVTSVIGSFQVFAFVYVMTEGGPLHSTDVVVYHIYQNAWEYLKMGYASAMSWVFFLIIMAATWIQFKLLGKRMEY
jgi:multiple sugar transport system permease protein